MAMLNAVDWTLLDHAAAEPVRVGDLVSADAGGMPIYQVTRVGEGRAWLAGERAAASRDMPLAGFRWRGVAA